MIFDISKAELIINDTSKSYLTTYDEHLWVYEYVGILYDDYTNYSESFEHYITNFVNKQELKRLLNYLNDVISKVFKDNYKNSNNKNRFLSYLTYQEYLYNKDTLNLKDIIRYAGFKLCGDRTHEKLYEVEITFGKVSLTMKIHKDYCSDLK